MTTPRDDPLLLSAVGRVVSAFSAVCSEAERLNTDVDLPAFLRLLRDSKLGLTPDETNAIRNNGERRLAVEVWAEVTKRRAEGAFPYRLRQATPQ